MSEKSVTVLEDHLILTNLLMIEKKKAKEGKRGEGDREKGRKKDGERRKRMKERSRAGQ